MHTNEIDIQPELVRALVDAQFPAWRDAPLRRVASSGTDNAIFRLGDALAVRLPRIGWAAGQPAKEYRWLPKLAPHLPLRLPLPVALGAPAFGYPHHWSIVEWIEGASATVQPPSDLPQAGRDLAAFVRALHAIDTTGAPLPDQYSAGRGVDLHHRSADVDRSIARMRELDENLIDIARAERIWHNALATPLHRGKPVWLHGDIHGGNLLTHHDRLVAAIDWGCMGVGDPACDLIAAWLFLDAKGRAAFHAALGMDDATWQRGRGWAVSIALNALPYYLSTNPAMVRMSLHTIEQLFMDD